MQKGKIFMFQEREKVVAEPGSPFQDKEKLVEDLFASVPSTMTLEEAESERRKKIGKS